MGLYTAERTCHVMPSLRSCFQAGYKVKNSVLRMLNELVGAIGFEPSPTQPFQTLAGLGWQPKYRNGSQRNNYWAKGRGLRTVHERPANRKTGAQLILRSRAQCSAFRRRSMSCRTRGTRMCMTSRCDREDRGSTVRAVLKDLVPRDHSNANIGNPATRRQLPVEVACGCTQTLRDEVPGQTAVG